MNAAHAPAAASGIDARRRWCLEARTLAAAGDGRGRARLRLSDTACLGRLPDWVRAEPAERASLALRAGAVLAASRLRRCIDGRVLAPLSARLGASRLAAVQALRPPIAPPSDWGWGADAPAALTALGGEAMVRAAAPSPAVALRLARLVGTTNVLGEADPADLRRVVDLARMLGHASDAATGAGA
jgi:hypothetical protein